LEQKNLAIQMLSEQTLSLKQVNEALRLENKVLGDLKEEKSALQKKLDLCS